MTYKIPCFSALGTTPLTATAAMPSSSMRIFFGEPSEGLVAENVKIGDPLALVVSIDDQDIYGMHVTSCTVRDGLGWSDQDLINSEGCPLDTEIMGEFEYSASKTTALVRFQAHKFPYTSSVYYQCNVKLCIKHAGGCDQVVRFFYRAKIPNDLLSFHFSPQFVRMASIW